MRILHFSPEFPVYSGGVLLVHKTYSCRIDSKFTTYVISMGSKFSIFTGVYDPETEIYFIHKCHLPLI